MSESVIDGLLQEFREDPDRTVEVTLPNGRVFKFRAVRDYDELLELKEEAIARHKSWKAGKVPPEWKPFLPRHHESAASIFLLAKMIVDPVLGEFDFMRLAKEAPQLMGHLALGFENAIVRSAVEGERIEQEQAKNE